MHRYWFEFEQSPSFPLPIGLSLGCGVTAKNLDDAENILREHIFFGKPFPKVLNFIEDVDLNALDQGHIIPNMGNHFLRGIWFPLGYS